MSNYLLDTNAVIAQLKGDANIIKMLRAAQSIAIPTIVIGELFYGAEKSGRVTANLKEVEGFIVGRTILTCDVETTRCYGRIANQLRVKGTPISPNDIWIAAIARQNNLILLTRDSDFKNVDGLALQAW